MTGIIRNDQRNRWRRFSFQSLTKSNFERIVFSSSTSDLKTHIIIIIIMVIQTQFLPPPSLTTTMTTATTTPLIELSTPITPITPPMEKLTLLRARMASRKQRLAQAFPEFHGLDDSINNNNEKRMLDGNVDTDGAAVVVSPSRPFKKRRVLLFQKKKSVCFQEDKNTIVLIERAPQDLQNSWLSQDDYKTIGQGNKETLIAITRAKGDLSYLNADRICPRGLEEYISQLLFPSDSSDSNCSSSRSTTTDNRVRKYVHMVLMQAQFQRKCGVNDPESLGRFAAYLSRDSCRKALRMAKMDSYCCQKML